MPGFLYTTAPLGERYQVTTDGGNDLEAIVAAGGGPGAAVAVTRVMFVDGTLGSASGDGSLSAPYDTVQHAFARIVAAGWASACIMLAPGTYAASHSFVGAPALHDLCIQGWVTTDDALFPADMPSLVGTIHVAPGISLQFSNVSVAASVAPPNPATDVMLVTFTGCRVDGTVAAGSLTLLATRTRFFNTILGNVACEVTLDGYTWAAIVTAGVSILPVDYSRKFLDTAADTYSDTLAINGVPLLTGVLLTTDHPRTRPGEYAICTLDALSTAADFSVTFMFTQADTVSWLLFNISRSPGNFSEAMHSVVFHSDMSTQPRP